MPASLKEIILPLLPLSDDSLILRAAVLQELMVFHAATLSDNRNRMTCRPIVPQNAASIRRGLEKRLEDPNTVLLGVFLESKLVGRISLNDYNPRNRSAEIGYWSLPASRGKGCMRRALGMLSRTVLHEGVLNKLTVQTGAFNTSSLALMKALGFHEEGRLREHHELDGILYDDVLFSLTAGDIRGRKL